MQNKENMNYKFDEFTKNLAQSVTRRTAFKQFGVGLAGLALAGFGLAPKACGGDCKKLGSPCSDHFQCCSGFCNGLFGARRGHCASPI